MHPHNDLPPVREPGYAREREQAQLDKILASMEWKLHGRVSRELRHLADGRPARAESRYGPHRW